MTEARIYDHGFPGSDLSKLEFFGNLLDQHTETDPKNTLH